MELKRFEVRELINDQEKTAIAEAEKLLEQIQKEIAELRKSEDELDKLFHAEDSIHFLQVIPLTLMCDSKLCYCDNVKLHNKNSPCPPVVCLTSCCERL